MPKPKMKAWYVRDKHTSFAEIVFAETRGKAKVLALATDWGEDAEFTDIEAYRRPQIDKYYKSGKWHLEWEHPKDRIILVKECNFTCDVDYFDWDECDVCSAREYCDLYKEKVRESFEEHDNEVQWSGKGKCPITPEQFNAIYEDEGGEDE